MEARIYQHCLVPSDTHQDDQPYAKILHESYYECKIYVSLWSTAACTTSPDPAKKHPKQGGTIATIGILVFVGMACYFTVGAYMRHKKGHEGIDRIPHKEFWASIPSLAKDGLSFTKAKIDEKRNKGGDGDGISATENTALFT